MARLAPMAAISVELSPQLRILDLQRIQPGDPLAHHRHDRMTGQHGVGRRKGKAVGEGHALEDLQRVRGIKQSLLLSERTYRCLRCGFACDRDENVTRNLQVFDPAARSAVADVETRKSDTPMGLPGRRSIHRTGSPLPLHAGS